MEYYFSKTIAGSFDNAIQKVTEALKADGFGILTEIVFHDCLFFGSKNYYYLFYIYFEYFIICVLLICYGIPPVLNQ